MSTRILEAVPASRCGGVDQWDLGELLCRAKDAWSGGELELGLELSAMLRLDLDVHAPMPSPDVG